MDAHLRLYDNEDSFLNSALQDHEEKDSKKEKKMVFLKFRSFSEEFSVSWDVASFANER